LCGWQLSFFRLFHQLTAVEITFTVLLSDI
jgi:hypothetical protein